MDPHFTIHYNECTIDFDCLHVTVDISQHDLHVYDTFKVNLCQEKNSSISFHEGLVITFSKNSGIIVRYIDNQFVSNDNDFFINLFDVLSYPKRINN